jgi:hypothetical protein
MEREATHVTRHLRRRRAAPAPPPEPPVPVAVVVPPPVPLVVAPVPPDRLALPAGSVPSDPPVAPTTPSVDPSRHALSSTADDVTDTDHPTATADVYLPTQPTGDTRDDASHEPHVAHAEVVDGREVYVIYRPGSGHEVTELADAR